MLRQHPSTSSTGLMSALSSTPALTLQAVGPVSELQSEVVVGGAVGVQCPRHLPAADEAVLPTQDDDGAVDQLHDELLRLAWRRAKDTARSLESRTPLLGLTTSACAWTVAANQSPIWRNVSDELSLIVLFCVISHL